MPKKISSRKNKQDQGPKKKHLDIFERLNKSKNREQIIYGLVVLVLIVNPLLFFKLGQHSANKKNSPGTILDTSSALPKLKTSRLAPSESSSGYLHIVGKVKEIGDLKLTIKLSSGALVTFNVDNNTKYINIDKKVKPFNDLKKDNNVVINATVSEEGIFKATNIQQKK